MVWALVLELASGHDIAKSAKREGQGERAEVHHASAEESDCVQQPRNVVGGEECVGEDHRKEPRRNQDEGTDETVDVGGGEVHGSIVPGLEANVKPSSASSPSWARIP